MKRLELTYPSIFCCVPKVSRKTISSLTASVSTTSTLKSLLEKKLSSQPCLPRYTYLPPSCPYIPAVPLSNNPPQIDDGSGPSKVKTETTKTKSIVSKLSKHSLTPLHLQRTRLIIPRKDSLHFAGNSLSPFLLDEWGQAAQPGHWLFMITIIIPSTHPHWCCLFSW
ncbi:hypothetical protein BU24DRAFT_10023 [Aaosphaeria arxii CBS 175.79]|uniref:Uncharacterized protein n=1 Tax=Aaosphaeria arxii CBS 175.79 TaxID=1450172 RepID=A0A6A5Y7U7_9PLEO|nr:uncharacterized protein BU24DRAFT_10023 [Aaosphaeria arxii CBS 175.79]KAF2020870.1 hypothetical protein BU24DRAFT_10023 [Aaosphaeria arxii CBS 175.79]